MNFIYAILASIFVSLISLVGIFSLIIKEKILEKIIFLLISFAAGSLIGASFIHILPEVVEISDSPYIFYYVLGGFITFFVLEKYFLWRHCHRGGECELHPVSYLNLFGDFMHNFFDGVFIGSSFFINFSTGIIATIAVILHEIPQEFGDFGILLYSGLNKFKALFFNFIVSFSAIFGAVLGYILSDRVKNISFYILPIIAGGFIYISSCDLIPELHREKDISKTILSLALFILGILFMVLLKIFFQ